MAGHPVWPGGGSATPRSAVWGRPDHPQWPRGWFGCSFAYISASKPYQWTSKVFLDITRTSNPSTLNLIRFFTSTDDSISSISQNPNPVPNLVRRSTRSNSSSGSSGPGWSTMTVAPIWKWLRQPLGHWGWFSRPQTGQLGVGRTIPGQTGWPATTYGWFSHPSIYLYIFLVSSSSFLDFFFFLKKKMWWGSGIKRPNWLNCHNLKVLRD